jgi:hypothetical protein
MCRIVIAVDVFFWRRRVLNASQVNRGQFESSRSHAESPSGFPIFGAKFSASLDRSQAP